MSCIYYPIWFQKNQEQIKALFDSDSEVNAMNSAFA